MSDVYELDPDFAEQKQKKLNRPKHDNSQPAQVSAPAVRQSQVFDDKKPIEKSAVMSFYEQNKTLIIIAIAVVIVLIICLAYWYFNKSSETVQVGPGPPNRKIDQKQDNVAPPNLDNIPIHKSNANSHGTDPNQKQRQNPNQTYERPITHEELVANTDDAEIDKYMNPEEPSYTPDENKIDKSIEKEDEQNESINISKLNDKPAIFKKQKPDIEQQTQDTVLNNLDDLKDS